jgi:hypothetical protein
MVGQLRFDRREKGDAADPGRVFKHACGRPSAQKPRHRGRSTDVARTRSTSVGHNSRGGSQGAAKRVGGAIVPFARAKRGAVIRTRVPHDPSAKLCFSRGSSFARDTAEAFITLCAISLRAPPA